MYGWYLVRKLELTEMLPKLETILKKIGVWRMEATFQSHLLILLFTKPIIEVSGWLYQTKTHFTHIVYQPFSRVLPPSFTLYGLWSDPVSNSAPEGLNLDPVDVEGDLDPPPCEEDALDPPWGRLWPPLFPPKHLWTKVISMACDFHLFLVSKRLKGNKIRILWNCQCYSLIF